MLVSLAQYQLLLVLLVLVLLVLVLLLLLLHVPVVIPVQGKYPQLRASRRPWQMPTAATKRTTLCTLRQILDV